MFGKQTQAHVDEAFLAGSALTKALAIHEIDPNKCIVAIKQIDEHSYHFECTEFESTVYICVFDVQVYLEKVGNVEPMPEIWDFNRASGQILKRTDNVDTQPIAE